MNRIYVVICKYGRYDEAGFDIVYVGEVYNDGLSTMYEFEAPYGNRTGIIQTWVNGVHEFNLDELYELRRK